MAKKVKVPSLRLGSVSVAAWRPDNMTDKAFKQLMTAFTRRVKAEVKGLKPFGIKASVDAFVE